MPTFSPPTRDAPRVAYPISPADERFWNYFGAPRQGVNVFKLTDGTYTTTQPADDSTVAIWYLGGHIYTVDSSEALSLRTAGFEVEGDIELPSGGLIGDYAGVLVAALAGTQVGDL